MSKHLDGPGDVPLHQIPHRERLAAAAEIVPMIIRASGARADLERILIQLFSEKPKKPEEDRVLSAEDQDTVLDYTQRFVVGKGPSAIISTPWQDLERSLLADPAHLWSLAKMMKAGHNPKLIDERRDSYHFGTTTVHAIGSRVAYDAEDQAVNMERWPAHEVTENAVDSAAAIGTQVMSEETYRALQSGRKVDPEKFGEGSRSWLRTSEKIRREGMEVRRHSAGKALSGGIGGGVLHIEKRDLGHASTTQGWRAELEVPRI